jgi:hypothetical protein
MFFEGFDRGRFSNASESDSNALTVLTEPIHIKPPILWANFMLTGSFITFRLDEDTACLDLCDVTRMVLVSVVGLN